MSYLVFRGVSTNDIPGVYVSKMPDHKKAAMRRTEYHVKGRDGALSVDEGFENFDLQVTLVLVDAPANTRQLVNAWADGTGKLITSDDLTKAYKASVKDEVRWSRVPGNTGFFDTAKITFDCQPFMFEAVDSQIVIDRTTPGAITNPGSAEAYPLIKVEGEGTCDFSFCGEYIILYDVNPNDPVFIDCENGYIYTAGGTARAMVGNIPKIPLGQSQVIFNLENGIQQMTITPKWRWV